MGFGGVQGASLKISSKVFPDTWAPKAKSLKWGLWRASDNCVWWFDLTARGKLPIVPGGCFWGTMSSGHQPITGKVTGCNQLCYPEPWEGRTRRSGWNRRCLWSELPTVEVGSGSGPVRALSDTHPVPVPIRVFSSPETQQWRAH